MRHAQSQHPVNSMQNRSFLVTPAVACMRDGEPAELVARMRDWPVFAQACERLLAPAGAEPAPEVGGNA